MASSQAVIELGAFAIGDVEVAESLLDQLGYRVTEPQQESGDMSPSDPALGE